MIVSELRLYNFRRFHSVNGEPGLCITFHKGLNALIGENDSGKSAVIDALKLVLLVQGNEYVRPFDDDFYSDGQSVSDEFRIDCTLSDFTQNEAKNFIEYLTFKRDGDRPQYYLQLHYRAWKEGHRIFHELRVGDADSGSPLGGKAQDLLRAMYLRPLRDAEREMSAGRNSRLSQILLGHSAFANKDGHELLDIFRDANKRLEQYFAEGADGGAILQAIRENMRAFNDQDQPSDAALAASDIQLKAILESLSLSAAEVHPGLGELNLLFIAAEMLLLKDNAEGGLRLALVEELEAHLHPQVQLRLISYLQREYSENDAQIIISTHSPVLASRINLKNLILLKNGKGFNLAEGQTRLQKSDYLFLQRFLDATKANLFFAKGIIMVEGDAESILIPVLAEILGYSLERYGISIVNVGGTAFLRYSRIMMRADGSRMGIPVSVITDCDVRPEYQQEPSGDDGACEFVSKLADSEAAVDKKRGYYSGGDVRAFVSPRWTLEYCLAMSALSSDFHRAIHYGKKLANARDYISLTEKKIREAEDDAAAESQQWESLPPNERAHKIYSLMLDSKGSTSLKAIVAQCFASLLRWRVSTIPEGTPKERMFDSELYGWSLDEKKVEDMRRTIEDDPQVHYIVQAIQYAAGRMV